MFNALLPFYALLRWLNTDCCNENFFEGVITGFDGNPFCANTDGLTAVRQPVTIVIQLVYMFIINRLISALNTLDPGMFTLNRIFFSAVLYVGRHLLIITLSLQAEILHYKGTVYWQHSFPVDQHIYPRIGMKVKMIRKTTFFQFSQQE